MNKLDELSECRAKRDLLEDDRIRECTAVMECVRPQLDAINERYNAQLAEVADAITALEDTIKRDVLQYKERVA